MPPQGRVAPGQRCTHGRSCPLGSPARPPLLGGGIASLRNGFCLNPSADAAKASARDRGVPATHVHPGPPSLSDLLHSPTTPSSFRLGGLLPSTGQRRVRGMDLASRGRPLSSRSTGGPPEHARPAYRIPPFSFHTEYFHHQQRRAIISIRNGATGEREIAIAPRPPRSVGCASPDPEGDATSG
jgi:hypothetical protein